jgi:hypothetical protein
VQKYSKVQSWNASTFFQKSDFFDFLDVGGAQRVGLIGFWGCFMACFFCLEGALLVVSRSDAGEGDVFGTGFSRQ